MDGLGGYYAELNKSYREGQILYDTTSVQNFKIQQTSEYSKKKHIHSYEEQTVVTSGQKKRGNGNLGQKSKRQKLLCIK